MNTTLSELDKLVLHTIVSTLQVQRSRTITADVSFLYDLGYSDEAIKQSLEKMRRMNPETALKEARLLETKCH